MAISPANFAFIQKLLAEHSAIALENEKAYLVETRLGPIARQIGCQSIDELVQRLRMAPDHPLWQQVIDAMTTNETSFYRDQVPFERLRDEILPDLLQRRATLRQLNVWSAGSRAAKSSSAWRCCCESISRNGVTGTSVCWGRTSRPRS